MSAVLATAPAATDLRAIARSLSCLVAVVAVHVAVLVLLPAVTRSVSAPAAPVTVTLITPPVAPKVMPSAPAREVMPSAPAPKIVPSAPAPKIMPSAPAVESRPREVKRVAPQPKPAKVLPPKQQAQPTPKPSLTPGADTRSANIDSALPPVVTPAPPAASPSAADTQAQGPGREADAVRDQAGSAPAQEISPPRFDAAYLDNPKPEYPRLARRMGEQGTVLLDVYVDANGLPEKIGLNASSGSPRLDRAAREIVRRWKFVPARQGERAVGAWIVVPIRFVLEG